MVSKSERHSFDLVGPKAKALMDTIDQAATARRGKNLTPSGCASCTQLVQCHPLSWHNLNPTQRINPAGNHMSEPDCAIKNLLT